MPSPKEILFFENREIHLVRKPRRRSLTIKLVPHQPVQVLANVSVSNAVVLQFLLERKDWIEKNLSRFEERYVAPTDCVLTPGKKFPLRGEWKTLSPVITLHSKHFFSETKDLVLFHIPRNKWSADSKHENFDGFTRQFHQFYRHLAVREISEKLRHWSQVMDLKPSKVSFRLANTRWGSCSSSRKISLNWKLICLSSEIQDYVIVHELSHLVHLNHSKSFWQLVETFVPERKRIQKELSKNQLIADFLN